MLYKLVENVLPIDTCIIASGYLLGDDRGCSGDFQVSHATVIKNTKYLQVLLPIIQLKLEEVWSKKLIPTYSYSRIMYPKAVLEPHTDRPSCEYSVSVTMWHNYPVDHSFPIYMGGTPIEIPVGCGVTYKGCEVQHWREPLTGDSGNFWIQAFFHYVDANGPHAEWAWDKKY